jgi:hypothetical protein
MLPMDGESSKFAQIYFSLNESTQRNEFARQGGLHLQPQILREIESVLEVSNPFVNQFRAMKTMVREEKLRIVDKLNNDKRRYNTPTAREICAYLPGNQNDNIGKS